MFEEFFHTYYSPLCNYAAKIIHDDVMAEDIVQNLFMQLWENDKLKTIEKPERYLLRATKFKCIDYLRAKKVTTEIIPDKLPPIIESDSDMSDEDIEPLLNYYASKLPPKTRQVFLYSRQSGMTYKEISIEMNISPKTVENQMGRALRMMKSILTKQELLLLIMALNISSELVV